MHSEKNLFGNFACKFLYGIIRKLCEAICKESKRRELAAAEKSIQTTEPVKVMWKTLQLT